MTLSAGTRNQYNGDDSTASFPITFILWTVDDPTVILTDSNGVETIWTRGTQYNISLVSPPATATLTVVTSPIDYTPATGETLTILSSIANAQAANLAAGGALPSKTVEQMADKAVRQIQQSAEEIDRSVKFKKSSTQIDVTIAEPEAGKIIRWNSAADGLENADATAQLTTPVSLADGGTGGTTAATALTNLGIKLSAQRIALWRLGQF